MNACVRAPGLLHAQPVGCVLKKACGRRAARFEKLLQSRAASAASLLHSPYFSASPQTIPEKVTRPATFAAPVSSHPTSRLINGGATWLHSRSISHQAASASLSHVPRLESYQQSWLRKEFVGAGLAAAGAAALIANALKSDAAECEPADSQAEVRAEGGERRQLYPPTEPHTSGYLQVSDLHKIYWEECGNPNGQPVVFLHGGPGAGTAPVNRRFFDPEFYRIILVDQRGAGKSIPHASLVENTTWHLVEDLEKLRKILKIDKWLVFGGSWGSTLSLAYAQTHPERVVGLVLRGIFMIRKHEINWFYQRGADHIFPDAWEPYRDFIPPDERSGLVAAYHRRLMNDKDPETQMAAARAWTAWEMSTAYLRPSQESKERGEDDKFALAFARIENHYFINGGFFPTDSWLLDNVGKLRHIPAVIIQGRYDVVCPMTSAWDLHRAWPEAEFRVVPDAGHSANEVGIGAELVAATERFKCLYADDRAGDKS